MSNCYKLACKYAIRFNMLNSIHQSLLLYQTNCNIVQIPLSSGDNKVAKLEGSSPYQNTHNSFLHDKRSEYLSDWDFAVLLHTQSISAWRHRAYARNVGSPSGSTEQLTSAHHFFHLMAFRSVCKKRITLHMFNVIIHTQHSICICLSVFPFEYISVNGQ